MSNRSIAIVHYHLRRGGVRRVVQTALDALKPHDCRVVLLCGEPPEGPLDAKVRIVDELAYDGQPEESSEDLAERLLSTAGEALQDRPDIWHVHNHSLGKNLALPAAVHALAKRGEKLLLQIHDFAEDGRPENYRSLRDGLARLGLDLGPTVYPGLPNVHFAVLNSRDRDFFRRAGAPDDRLHLLPNAVCVSPLRIAPPPNVRRFLYPTRAIRRKNLGEFLLHATLERDGEQFGVTLAPQNPAARPVYDAWVDLAGELSLPVEFEVGAKVDRLEESMALADAAATTSVAEGFGLAFLEPWLMGRPVLGRDLPDITADARDAGLDLHDLYSRLDVPLDWIGQDALRSTIRDALSRSLDAFARPLDDGDVERAFHAFTRDGLVDFGRLNEDLQTPVLRRLRDDGQHCVRLREAMLDRLDFDEGRIRRNRDVIADRYGLAQYGKRLSAIYARLAAGQGTQQTVHAGRLLDAFLDPARFNLLRTL
jgi:glycosyltransferase involved in cell wall biosynthesis